LAKLLDGNDANDGAAIGMLRDFIDDVEVRRGNQITDADADGLVSDAEEIISILQTA
jgi:hypothetical protein